MHLAELQIDRIRDSADPRFTELVNIYAESHPESERKPLATLHAMLARPEYYFLAASDQGCVVGFVIFICLPNAGACLLEYMAVTPSRRHQGIGQRLLKHVLALKDVSEGFLLAELDSDKIPSPEQPEHQRRKAFYRKLGLREVEGFQYIMPPVSTSAPPAMDMLVYKGGMAKYLAVTQLENWLKRIYVEVYSLPENDPRIDTMIENLPKKLRLI